MKLRTDFVTNSSSSSFVIAYQKPKDAYHAFVLDLFLDSADNCDSTCAERVDDLQSLESLIQRWYGWKEKQDLSEILAEEAHAAKIYWKAKEALSDGCSVAFKDVSYHDDTLLSMAEMLASNGDMTILSREG